MNEMRQNPI